MASTAPQSAVAAAPASLPRSPFSAPGEQAIFSLSEPLVIEHEGHLVEVGGFGMRTFGRAELSLLDHFNGQPVALAENVIAALCDITVEQVRQLALDDFTMLAADALFQVEQVSLAMGLPRRFFLQARPPKDGSPEPAGPQVEPAP
ncbi:MAG: hypothetical protein RLZZ444_1100 [Pseudomonadota bacterium]|jgi:hypothetical protein